MKIQNTSSVGTPVPVSFMNAIGGTISIKLNSGEFVYTDSPATTKSILILLKKGHIKIFQEDKPDNLEYFKIYNQSEADTKTQDSGQILAKSLTKFMESNPPETKIPSAEKTVVKNKGGRPKGSKDTIKRGEPKLKKPAGRPINTKTLEGMTVEEVKSKCASRGYEVRITNEDGKAYMITHDLRLDRVEIQVEKGIVINANIG